MPTANTTHVAVVADFILVPLVVITGCAPLACRLSGWGAVVLVRIRTGVWPRYYEAQNQFALTNWIHDRNLDHWAWIVGFGAPFLLACWLFVGRWTGRGASPHCRIFQWLAATWAIAFSSAWLLAWVS